MDQDNNLITVVQGDIPYCLSFVLYLYEIDNMMQFITAVAIIITTTDIIGISMAMFMMPLLTDTTQR